MKDNEELVYGILTGVVAILCFTWMKEDSFSLLGLFTVKCRTLGIIFGVVSVINLIGSGILEDLFDWVIDHWLLILVAAAVLYVVKGDGFDGFSLWKRGEDMPTAQSQPQETVAVQAPDDAQYRPTWNTGVCRTLSEDICVVALFINDSPKPWADYTISWFLENKIEPGLRFIREEAAEYGQNIRVEYLTYTGVTAHTQIQSYNTQQGAGLYDVLVEASANLGFGSPQEMLEYHREYTGIQQIVYMLCSNGKGRPYAHSSGSPDADALEYCAVFCDSENSNASSYNTIFHEVLHLFGAQDYYAEGTARVARQKMAQRLCPNDIMLNSYNAGLRDIGRFTAYSIGWLDAMPEEYNHPDWWK